MEYRLNDGPGVLGAWTLSGSSSLLSFTVSLLSLSSLTIALSLSLSLSLSLCLSVYPWLFRSSVLHGLSAAE